MKHYKTLKGYFMWLLAVLVVVFIIYWFIRPETYRYTNTRTKDVAQAIPQDIPTGRTAFVSRPAGDLNMMEMFYRVAGDTTNPVVLLVHGISGNSAATWHNTYADLSREYYVVGLDLRGHGLTTQPPGAYSIEMMADDVNAFMSALNIERAHIVGHSMGGLVVMQLAHSYPDTVQSLVLIDTAATWNQGIYALGFPFYPNIVRVKNRVVGWEQENRDRANAFSSEVSPEYHEWIYQQRSINRTEPYIASWRAINNFSAVDFLPQLRQPTLIIYGEDDDLVPQDFRDQLHRLIVGSHMVIIPSPARHYPHIQFSAQVNPTMMDFFEQHTTDIE